MVHVSLRDDDLVLEVQGLDKLWAFKSRLEIPLRHIRGVRADPTVARGWWKGLRAPGTHIPGVIAAGTFYRDGKRVFWDVHHAEHTIVLTVSDDRYDELIVEVENPEKTVATVRAALAERERS